VDEWRRLKGINIGRNHSGFVQNPMPLGNPLMIDEPTVGEVIFTVNQQPFRARRNGTYCFASDLRGPRLQKDLLYERVSSREKTPTRRRSFRVLGARRRIAARIRSKTMAAKKVLS